MPDDEIPGMYGLCYSDLPLSEDEIEDLKMSGALDPDEPHDSNHTMIPMPGNALRRECGRCRCEIEPFEPYHRGKNTGVLWCDTCYAEDVASD